MNDKQEKESKMQSGMQVEKENKSRESVTG
jgi:hypothetical protein